MDDLKFADAVSLLAQQDAHVIMLWGFYAAAAFVLAGFGGSARMRPWEARAVIAGFWLFAIGHLSLLLGAVDAQVALGRAIAALPLAHAGALATIDALRTTNVAWYVSAFVHLAIDVCATLAMLARVRAHGGPGRPTNPNRQGPKRPNPRPGP